MSERLSAEQVLHSVFSDDDSDVSGCDSSDDGEMECMLTVVNNIMTPMKF